MLRLLTKASDDATSLGTWPITHNALNNGERKLSNMSVPLINLT